jgi:glycerol-3-phosphate acyltransferase PlsY
MRGIDIREHGSGNIGATNIFRILGAPTGIMVFLLDILKGYAPVAIGKVMVELKVKFAQPAFIEPAGNHELISTACVLFALAAVIGHNYTFWLGFKGGKGIATSAGVMLAFMPWVFTGSLIIWVLVFSLSRYVALASMAAALAIPLQIFILAMIDSVPVSIPKLCFGIFAAIMAIWRHRSNIRRLMAGRELRFERKKNIEKKS